MGVYAAMSGPAYETPTEVRFLQQAGATVVGMSMVPESLPSRALDMRVLGLCSLTNAFGEHVEHDEVVRVSNETAIAVGRLLVDLLPRCDDVGEGKDRTMTQRRTGHGAGAGRPGPHRVGRGRDAGAWR